MCVSAGLVVSLALLQFVHVLETGSEIAQSTEAYRPSINFPWKIYSNGRFMKLGNLGLPMLNYTSGLMARQVKDPVLPPEKDEIRSHSGGDFETNGQNVNFMHYHNIEDGFTKKEKHKKERRKDEIKSIGLEKLFSKLTYRNIPQRIILKEVLGERWMQRNTHRRKQNIFDFVKWGAPLAGSEGIKPLKIQGPILNPKPGTELKPIRMKKFLHGDSILEQLIFRNNESFSM